MQFINPYFLFALAAIAIPIIVHLFNFRRYKKVYFSNTSFLKELVEESNRAQKIKRILILLSRCLAIIFLVLAFAQPFIPKSTQKKEGKTVVSIFIDNSFSMQSQTSDRTLLEKAKLLAIDIAQSYENDVSFQLITQDLSGKQQRLLSKDDFINQLKDIQLCPKSYSLENIKQRQIDATQVASFDNKKFYYITDFQKQMGELSIDSIHELNLVYIQAPSQNNIYIDSAWLENPVTIIGQNNKLLVKICNESDKSIDKLRLSMKINGQQKAITDNSIMANTTIIDTIYFNQNTKEWNNVAISLDDLPIEFDNTYYVSFFVNDAIHLLNLDASSNNKYINALANFSSYFKTTSGNSSQIDYSSFKSQQLIILSNIKELSSGFQIELKKYIQNGGHIAFFPSKDADITNLNTFLKSIGTAQLSSANTSTREVGEINIQASLLNDIFEKSSIKNTTLPKTTFSYNLTNTLGNAEKIISYKDGQSFMTQYNIEKGKCYLFSVPLDINYCDLPIHALFAPLIFKMAIDGQITTNIQNQIGSKNNIEIPNLNITSQENMLYVRGNEIEFIPEQYTINNTLEINVKEQLLHAGNYSLFDKKTTNNMAYFAMNYNREESKMNFYSMNTLEQMYSSKMTKIYNGNTGIISHAITENNEGIVLWKVCIIFVLLFLLIEILLIRFWKT